jgi:hypothetical protein
MATYSTNLALTLLTTGEGAGTWGNTTNTNLGTLLEQAISGYVTQGVSTGTDTTLTIPNGATGVARNMYIELTGTGGANTNLVVPSNKKLYFIFNNASGAVTVKVAAQTGVSVPAGKKVVLVSNGTDVVNGLNYIADFGTNSFTVTNLTATSATITTLDSTSANITTLGSTSANITTLGSTSANITTLTGTTFGTTATTQLRGASAQITTLTSASANITQLQSTSATITTLTSTSANITTLTGTTVTYTGNGRVNSLGVGTAASGTAGEILATNNITAYFSDARLKNFQGSIPNALQKVKALNGYLYVENELAKSFGFVSGEEQVGVSAQEVAAVLPHIVTSAPFDMGPNGESLSGQNYMTVRYERLVPLLIEAIKELSAKVEALEGKE